MATRSLAFRFSLWAGIALIAVSAASLYIEAQRLRSTWVEEARRQAERRANLLAALTANQLFTFDQGELESRAAALSEDSSVRFIEIKDPSGRVLVTKGSRQAEADLVVATRNVSVAGTRVGSVAIALSTDSAKRAAAAAWQVPVARELTALLALFCVLAYLVRRLIVRPLGHLATVATRIAGGQDYSLRAAASKDDELGALTDAFNRMLSEVEARTTALREGERTLARALAQAEQRAEKLTALSTLSRLINSVQDGQKIFQEIAKTAATLLGAKLARVWVMDPGAGELSRGTGPGLDPALEMEVSHYPVIPRETGLVDRIIDSRAPEYIQDVQRDCRWSNQKLAEEAGLHAFAGLPLVTGDRVVGILSLLFPDRREFSLEEKELMSLLADHAAIAIGNSQLLEGLKTHQGRLEALFEVSRQLSRIQPVDSLLARIAEACGQLLVSDLVGIRVLEGDDLVLRATSGNAHELMAATRLRVGESLSGIVAATGEPLLALDPGDDPRLTPAHREAYRRLSVRAFLGVPVRAGDRLEGVLSVRTCQAQGYSKEDLAIATAFASQAATALENARLYQQAKDAYEALAQTQQQLTHAMKMEAVGRLAGGVAHDFNNLLTIITGRAVLMSERLVAADSPLRRDIDLIRKTADRAAALTKQLLAFSRKQVLQPKVLNLNTVAVSLAAMLQRLLNEDIELRIVPDPAVGAVKADLTQLEQVILNLVINARDAMPKGGKLTIETGNRELDETYARQHPEVQAAPYVMLAVTDTGCGMDAATQARIFEPFFTTKENGKGTGLGLSTVYGIVKQSGGHISVYSEVGRGSAFKIYLPRITDAAPALGPDQNGPARCRGSEIILLVEDEDDLRQLACEILQWNGYTVLTASDGVEALRLSEERPIPIHLLVTDVVMPHMSGRDLADRLTRRWPELKVLYMSGYTDDAIVHHGVLDPGVILLEKPFTPDALVQKVREILDAPAACAA